MQDSRYKMQKLSGHPTSDAPFQLSVGPTSTTAPAYSGAQQQTGPGPDTNPTDDLPAYPPFPDPHPANHHSIILSAAPAPADSFSEISSPVHLSAQSQDPEIFILFISGTGMHLYLIPNVWHQQSTHSNKSIYFIWWIEHETHEKIKKKKSLDTEGSKSHKDYTFPAPVEGANGKDNHC